MDFFIRCHTAKWLVVIMTIVQCNGFTSVVLIWLRNLKVDGFVLNVAVTSQIQSDLISDDFPVSFT